MNEHRTKVGDTGTGCPVGVVARAYGDNTDARPEAAAPHRRAGARLQRKVDDPRMVRSSASAHDPVRVWATRSGTSISGST